MTGVSLLLVLLSSLAHATWNFLLKRSANKEVFVWWMLATCAIILVPLGAALFWFRPVPVAGWQYVLSSTGLHVFYFVLLGRGYAHGDLSLVYPIARGMGPMLVPVLAVVILDESISSLAIAGIGLILVGIYTVSWWGNFKRVLHQPLALLKNSSTRYAILTGFTIAAYALVDKKGVEEVQPFLYMYLMTLGVALGLVPYIWRTQGVASLRYELRSNAWPIVIAGLLTFLAYGLVLTALSLSKVSYVAPAREVGIVIGVLMGVVILKEQFGAGRLVGSTFIVAGLVLIAVSP